MQPAPHDSRRRVHLAPWVLVMVGILGASLVTWRTSSALFTANTATGLNSFGTGSVAISDNASGTALFSVSGMKPGSNGQACIKVHYTGTLPANVRVYGTGETAQNQLDQYLTITIDEGSSGVTTFPSCTNFVVGTANVFNNTLNNIASTFANGYGSWLATNGDYRDYRIAYSLSAAAPNGTMSSTASVVFTWEAQNA